jgi:hypothetical protein
MFSKALPFLRQVLMWSLTQGTQYLGLCWGVRQECPSALALQRALCETFLACSPQQAATCLAEAAFELVVCSGHARHVIAMEQAGPIAPVDLVEVQTKRISLNLSLFVARKI